MGFNRYQETILHDRNLKGWGESNVFRIDYTDGSQKCHKEYIPTLDYTLLKDYHILHNYLAQHPLFKASSLSSKQEICTATIPYVGGNNFSEVARTSDVAMRFLCKTLDQFAQDVYTKNPNLFTTPEFLQENLCSVNMKCIVEGDEMKIFITDLCIVVIFGKKKIKEFYVIYL